MKQRPSLARLQIAVIVLLYSVCASPLVRAESEIWAGSSASASEGVPANASGSEGIIPQAVASENIPAKQAITPQQSAAQSSSVPPQKHEDGAMLMSGATLSCGTAAEKEENLCVDQ